MKEKIEVVWPLGKVAQSPQPLAPRLDTLEGKTICGLCNGSFYFDQSWPLIKQLLSKKYSGIKFVDWEKFGTVGDDESVLKDLPDKLRKYGCDAVVTGRGC